MSKMVSSKQVSTLSPQFGIFDLAAAQEGRVPLLTPPELPPDRLTMEAIESLVKGGKAGKGGAVMLLLKDLPFEMHAPFAMAGPLFARDLKERCEAVIFLPHLTDRSGKWWPGFEVNLAGAEPEELSSLFAELADPVRRLNRLLFINLYSETGERYQGEELHWIMTWLLGRLKVAQLLLDLGKEANQLSNNARTCFANWYQHSMLTALVDYLNHRSQSGEPLSEEEANFYETRMRDLAQEAAQLWAALPSAEQATFREVVSHADGAPPEQMLPK